MLLTPPLRQALESRLGEMFIERQRLLDAPAFHHHKRHAIRQRKTFVCVMGEIAPGFRKHRLVHMHEGDQLAGQQRFADADRLGMMSVHRSCCIAGLL